MPTVEIAVHRFDQEGEHGEAPQATGLPPREDPFHPAIPRLVVGTLAHLAPEHRNTERPLPRDYSWAPRRLPPPTSTGHPTPAPVYGPTSPPRLSEAGAGSTAAPSRAYQVCTAPAVGGAWAQWTSRGHAVRTRLPHWARSGSWRSARPRARRIRCARPVWRPWTQCWYTAEPSLTKIPAPCALDASKAAWLRLACPLNKATVGLTITHPPPRQDPVLRPAGLVNIVDGCPAGPAPPWPRHRG